jgi:hypothetical protein
MQISRIVIALIVAPLFGSLIYMILAGLDSMSFSRIPPHDDLLSTFVGMAILAVLFEVFILLPVAYLLRARVSFRLNLIIVGVPCWLALTAVGLALMGLNPLNIAITSAQLLALGVPVVFAFALLVHKAMHV